jgi:drug/metabolite transporter (DMT)-like permease
MSEKPISRFDPIRRVLANPYLSPGFAVLCWAGNFIVGRALHDSVPPLTLALWRWVGGLLVMLPFAWKHLRRDLPELLSHWRTMALLSGSGISAYNALLYIGLQSTTAVNALLLQSAAPIIIVASSRLVFGERSSISRLIALTVSLLGVIVIASHGSVNDLLHLQPNRGDAWVLAAVMSTCIYFVHLRRRPPVHMLSFLAATFVIGSLFLLPIWLSMPVGTPEPMDLPADLAAIAYLAVFPSALAYLCFNRGVDMIGGSGAGQFIHLLPIFGSILAVIVLGERLAPYHFAAFALIAAGAAWTAFVDRATPPMPEAQLANGGNALS